MAKEKAGSTRPARRVAAELTEDELLALAYDELRALARSYMRRERREHTLQPTALVHEAVVRIAGERPRDWQGRAHYLAIAARAMRQVLIDHARKRDAAKRGSGGERVTLDEGNAGTTALDVELLDLNQALDRLAALDAQHARIIELRYFAGLTIPEVAEVLRVGQTTIKAQWAVARAWLERELRA